MQFPLPKRDVVLLGIGHTNAHVLRMWKMRPRPETRLTCVSNFPVATYSGMLPGTLAGQYTPAQMQIDLVRLCAAARARLIVDRVTGLDVEQRQLLFESRPPLPFDVLSIGIGSVPTTDGVFIDDDTLLAIKPMQTFLARLDERLRGVTAHQPPRPLRVTIVGAGAGGVEMAFCLPRRIQAVLGDTSYELTLVHAGQELLSGAKRSTALKVRRELEARQVRLLLGQRVTRVTAGVVTLENGEAVESDMTLWCTGATAPPLLRQLNLPTDERGFLLTDRTLRTTAQAPIFSVGDSGTIADVTIPKAGVFAVRQGRVLWENIHRLLDGRKLQCYEPQRDFLKLFNTGDGRAIGEYQGFAFHTRWAWRLKDAIDTKFMAKYQDYSISPMPVAETSRERTEFMRCTGCGGKIAGSVLAKVLARLDIPASEHVLLGLSQPDDAAIVRTPSGGPLAVTVDFFTAPLDDPFLVGRIAAVNAASDIFALGARPIAALASVTLPIGEAQQQEQLLYDLMAGGLDELRRMGAMLVGGHTIEGPQLTMGFTVLADLGDNAPRTKADLRCGDRLVLTKPLGVGVLLAAHAQARCEAAWMDALRSTMLQSNQAAAAAISTFDISGMTDVTGFGLAGHLLEMLRASDAACELNLAEIGMLPGVEDLLAQGLESTLAPANREVEHDIVVTAAIRNTPRYAALFDPQTSGGLLLGVRDEQAVSLLAWLRGQGYDSAAEIGHITRPDAATPRLTIAAG